jgi:hypothetical protein
MPSAGASVAPDYVAELGATVPSNSCSVEGLGGPGQHLLLCPRRPTSQAQRASVAENWPDEHGKPLLRSSREVPRSVAEFKVVAAFRAALWSARWQDNFAAAPAWMKRWTDRDVPAPIGRLLDSTRLQSPRAKPWDVLAWREASVLFVACKATASRLPSRSGLHLGSPARLHVSPDQLAVARVTIALPPRTT